ncbi:MAG: hypothetical protein KME20_16305 [Kaiparowitsia implicata GSE-PSE-MK54-09C]|nr:hypothetical protein [Kaiparowitsia implicata GSE-PSE-MK54-09C]
MVDRMNRGRSRRYVLKAGLHYGALSAVASLASGAIAACSRSIPTAETADDVSQAQPQPQPPSLTPACGDAPTPPQTAGPFYTPNTPERTSLREPGVSGTPLLLTGTVLRQDCTPVAGAWLDFWQADDDGAYDNTGFRLRGHQYTDDAGRYRLETIVPGSYPGRTPHLHVMVQTSERSPLTTQLYFPSEPQNQRDGLFQPELLMTVEATDHGQQAAFDFVVS